MCSQRCSRFEAFRVSSDLWVCFVAIPPITLLARESEHPYPSRRTRGISSVGSGLRSAQRYGHHSDLHKTSDQVSELLLFHLSPASRSSLPTHKQRHLHCGDVWGPNCPADSQR